MSRRIGSQIRWQALLHVSLGFLLAIPAMHFGGLLNLDPGVTRRKASAPTSNSILSGFTGGLADVYGKPLQAAAAAAEAAAVVAAAPVAEAASCACNPDNNVHPFPFGHHYSPVSSPNDISFAKQWIKTDVASDTVPGIDMNTKVQLELLAKFAEIRENVIVPKEETKDRRAWMNNGWFEGYDIMSCSLLAYWTRPKRVLEIGSGFSSAAMMDISTLLQEQGAAAGGSAGESSAISFTFIEPRPDRLLRVAKGIDIKLFEQEVQTVSMALFDELQSGDWLFIDSSHVLKTGSDLEFLFRYVIPRVRPGVIVHLHDIFYAFEYRASVLDSNIGANENYFLRNFLQFNSEFEILLWPDYLRLFHHDELVKGEGDHDPHVPGSIYLRRRRKAEAE